MRKLESSITTLRRGTWQAGATLFLVIIASAISRGQAGVEAAGVDSSSAAATTAASKALPTSLPRPVTDSKSPYIPSQPGIPLEVTNRRLLEQRAGKDAAKALLQSAPSNAMIYIDGMFVGHSPLLLIVAPGKYKVEMRGQREEFGERLIDLSPNETQQLTLTLALRYPSNIMLQGHRASPPAGGITGENKVYADPSLPHPAAESNFARPVARAGSSADEMNRKALEQQAGPDAAKLNLQSVPSEALTYLDGTFVGRTPLSLIVPPGKYKVEMRGPGEEFAERFVGLLPNESQNLALTLAGRYPARVSTR
jgi:hypothetical protein